MPAERPYANAGGGKVAALLQVVDFDIPGVPVERHVVKEHKTVGTRRRGSVGGAREECEDIPVGARRGNALALRRLVDEAPQQAVGADSG